jgi:hypothetical protein
VIDAYCDLATEVLQAELNWYVDWLRRELGTEGPAKDGILAHDFVNPAKSAVDISERMHKVSTFRKWHENTWKSQAAAKDHPDFWMHKVTWWNQ